MFRHRQSRQRPDMRRALLLLGLSSLAGCAYLNPPPAPAPAAPPAFVDARAFRLANPTNRALTVVVRDASGNCYGTVEIPALRARQFNTCAGDTTLEMEDSAGGIARIPVSGGGLYDIRQRDGRWVFLPSI